MNSGGQDNAVGGAPLNLEGNFSELAASAELLLLTCLL